MGSRVTISYIAALCTFLFSGAGTFMNAALQTMMEAWPALSSNTVRLLVTLPPMISLPVTLLIGAAVGKKLSYRNSALFGILFILVGGVAPFFFYLSWAVIMVFRVLLGVGVGFLGMRNALLLKIVPKELQARYVGYGMSVMNLGAILANPIVGALADIGWRYSFLFDVLAVIPLIMIFFFLPEPDPEDASARPAKSEQEKSGTADASGAERLHFRTVYFILMQLLITTCMYPLLSDTSVYMADLNLGGSRAAGAVLSAYSITGALSAMFIYPMHKILKRKSLTVLCLVGVTGLGVLLFFPSTISMFIGAALCGISYNAMAALLQLYNGQTVPKSRTAFTSAMILAMVQLGVFFSNYYISICQTIFQNGSEQQSAFFGSMLIYLLIAVTSAIFRIVPLETNDIENKN